MKYFKNANNQVFAYEADGSQDAYIAEDLISITYEEMIELTAPPPASIPSVVSMRQARLALLQFGILEQVNTTIASGTDADKITWEYATEVRRNDALVQNMATALGLNEATLDSLFSLASSL